MINRLFAEAITEVVEKVVTRIVLCIKSGVALNIPNNHFKPEMLT
jgi:hypothetical protein